MLQTLIDNWVHMLLYIQRELHASHREIISWGHGYQIFHVQFNANFPELLVRKHRQIIPFGASCPVNMVDLINLKACQIAVK
jgi:hypothetical protein